MADIRRSQARLITSFHILHHHNLLDEGGSISIRHPGNPATFFTSNCSASLVSSSDELTEWHIDDVIPIRHQSADRAPDPLRTENAEIYVHSYIYAKYADVQSIVHTAAPELVVYGLCNANGSMLRSAFNQAGFVDEYNPIFDPAHHRSRLPATHRETLKIDHPELGAALAETLGNGINGRVEAPSLPQHGVAFVRGNGAVLWSQSLEDAVGRAVSLLRNAAIQTAAMSQRSDLDMGITYLTGAEARDCQKESSELNGSRWTTWAKESSRNPLYVNTLEEFI